MTWPFPHPPPAPTAALERRLRAHERRLGLLIPCRSRSDAHLLDHLRMTFVTPMVPPRPDMLVSGTGDGPEIGAHSGIVERNGIWVLTVDGVWVGDFRTRAQAEAAAERAAGRR